MSPRPGDPGTRTRPVFAPLAPREVWRDTRDYEAFRADVIAGLSRAQKSVPPKYFYDDTGAALFERICELPEYYLTRAETAILATHGAALAQRLGPEVTLVELGSGSSVKTRLLLDRLVAPHAYVPVDMAASSLAQATRTLHASHPGLLVLPVRADFTLGFALPPAAARAQNRAIFFPGSTIGNLEPTDAVLLMRKLRSRLPPGGWLIVGVDTRKDVAILERAYNDSQGVTAAFNRNLLARMRDELDCDVDPDAFAHLAFWNAHAGRIEMHLRSTAAQTVRVDGRPFRFESGETLHTENSYKYGVDEFAELARRAGFTPADVWQDDNQLFSVHCLRA